MFGPGEPRVFFVNERNVVHYTRHMHVWHTLHAPKLGWLYTTIPQTCPYIAKARAVASRAVPKKYIKTYNTLFEQKSPALKKKNCGKRKAHEKKKEKEP